MLVLRQYKVAAALIAAYVVATSLALILLKLGSQSGALVSMVENKVNLNLTILSTSGIFLYGVSFLIYTYLISKFDLGYIIPLTTALVYIVIFVASYFVFKEPFTGIKILAIGLILVGLGLLNSGK